MEKLKIWSVSADGSASPVTRGHHLEFGCVRAVVMAYNADDAVNQANAEAFKIGVKNATAESPAEIAICGEIGDPYQGCDAQTIGSFLRANRGRDVDVYINSPGGLAFDGIAMHNAFKAHDGRVRTIVDGFAGSAATIAAVGGSPVQIYENAQFMIHRASLMAFGNRDVMQEAMDWLDKCDEAIARTYKAKTGKALDKIMTMMAGPGKQDGTTMMAREAVENKFCDSMIPLKGSKTSNIAPFREATNTHFSSVELEREKRIRARRDFYLGSFAATTIKAKATTPQVPVEAESSDEIPVAPGSPMFCIGDRVSVIDADQSGEVRSCNLNWAYIVLADDGSRIAACEDELTAEVDEEDSQSAV